MFVKVVCLQSSRVRIVRGVFTGMVCCDHDRCGLGRMRSLGRSVAIVVGAEWGAGVRWGDLRQLRWVRSGAVEFAEEDDCGGRLCLIARGVAGETFRA